MTPDPASPAHGKGTECASSQKEGLPYGTAPKNISCSAHEDDVRLVEETRRAVLDEHAVRVCRREHGVHAAVEADGTHDERVAASARGAAQIARVARHAIRNDLVIVEVLVAVDGLSEVVLDDRAHRGLQAEAGAVDDEARVAADGLRARGRRRGRGALGARRALRGRRARRSAAERHIDVCRAEHICPYACRFREHAERYVAALHARGNRPRVQYDRRREIDVRLVAFRRNPR